MRQDSSPDSRRRTAGLTLRQVCTSNQSFFSRNFCARHAPLNHHCLLRHLHTTMQTMHSLGRCFRVVTLLYLMQTQYRLQVEIQASMEQAFDVCMYILQA